MTKLTSSLSQSKYGALYREHAFRQYEHYLASIDKIGDRRQDANHYFLSITTGLVTLIGLSFQLDATPALDWARIALAVIGLFICLVFWHLLYSYRQLLRGKFRVLYALEETLPLELSKHEWQVLGEGKNRTIYLPFSHTELVIPWVLGLIYVCTILFLLFGY